MYRQRPWGGILTGAVFLFGGILLKDIKTKEHRAGAELPKMLRHAPKELAKKGLLAAKEKEKEQLLQARRTEWAVRIRLLRKKVLEISC